MPVSELLLNVLEDLHQDDFEKFKWYLTQKVLEDFRPIPKSHLGDAARTRTVTKMIENYSEHLAVKITVEILRKQCNNDLADRLNKDYVEKVKPESSSCSTSAVTSPPAAATVSAQGGSVVIAPTLNSGTTGSWNINIHKP